MLVALLAAAGGFGSGCARRTDALTRRTFEQATGTTTRRGRRPQPPPDLSPDATLSREANQLASTVATIADMLAAPDSAGYARIHTALCEDGTPSLPLEERDTASSCGLREPTRVAGVEFHAEWSLRGVVALVSTPIADRARADVVASFARDVLLSNCRTAAWTAPGESADPEATTCVLERGPMLAVVRIPSDAGGDLWQVSVAVIAAG